MWIRYNPNPDGRNVGDCVIRALSKALEQDWETTYARLSTFGFMLHDMPSSNYVWGAYLKKEGYERHIVDDKGLERYTVADFCKDNPTGKYILAISGHTVCVEDGMYFDSWDSGNEIPIYYWRKK